MSLSWLELQKGFREKKKTVLLTG
ncbi:hypothetical protein LINPERHAP1_LOCUS19844 [Linum perenne]